MIFLCVGYCLGRAQRTQKMCRTTRSVTPGQPHRGDYKNAGAERLTKATYKKGRLTEATYNKQ